MSKDDKDRLIEIETVELEPSGDETEASPNADAAIDESEASPDLAHLQEENERLREMYLRKLADFENYRKRQEREMAEFRRHSNADLLRDCLAVVDNLERALEVPAEGDPAFRSGVELVLRQFKDLLARHGVQEVDPLGEPFDPTLHEAIQRQEAVDVDQNTVVNVFQKGYVFRDRLLRPAMVVVAVPSAGSLAPDDANPDSP